MSTDKQSLIQVGRVLDFFGLVTLPLGVGLLIGFYAADQGVRLMPTMLEIAVGWGIFALLCVALGRTLRGKGIVETDSGIRLRKRVVTCLVLAVLGLGLRVALYEAEKTTALTVLSEEEFETAFELDSHRYREHVQGMAAVLQKLEAAESLGEDVLTPDQESLLLESWRAMRSYSIALDQIRIFYENYWHFDPSRVERSYHLRSFLLTFAAELALYESASRFSSIVLANNNAKKFLETEHPGLPENSFSLFRQELLGTRDQARILAGDQYLKVLETGLRGRQESQGLGVGWLWSSVEEHLMRIDAFAPINRASLTVRADTQVLKRQVRRVWYPIQQGAAEVLGDTRVRRVGWYLIGEDELTAMDAHLEPGDILLSRKNWYLSNVGLPGFWPHAILYIGDPEKFSAMFDSDPAVLAWVQEETGRSISFIQYLQMKYPTGTLLYQLGHEGEDYRVIEAISEGVVFNTMAHAAGDYLAAMRPRLDTLARAQAIAYAFSQLEKPYDFDFDFATEHALVCTELVWRAYRPAEGKAGLEIPLVTVAGRQTLPANEIAQFYSRTVDSEDAQLDFVYFIDALEREQRVFVADEAAFRESGSRPQWDIAQK